SSTAARSVACRFESSTSDEFMFVNGSPSTNPTPSPVEIRDAIELLRDAVGIGPAVWADLGAGTGTFTLALARTLGPRSTVYAVDDDANAVRALRELGPASNDVHIVPVEADFTRPFELPGLGKRMLDGILLANALHFVRDGERVLTELASKV